MINKKSGGKSTKLKGPGSIIAIHRFLSLNNTRPTPNNSLYAIYIGKCTRINLDEKGGAMITDLIVIKCHEWKRKTY